MIEIGAGIELGLGVTMGTVDAFPAFFVTSLEQTSWSQKQMKTL